MRLAVGLIVGAVVSCYVRFIPASSGGFLLRSGFVFVLN